MIGKILIGFPKTNNSSPGGTFNEQRYKTNNCCLVIHLQSLLQLHTNTETTYSPLKQKALKKLFVLKD